LEGGPPIFRQDGSCPALLEDRCPGVPYGAVTRYGPPFQTLPVPRTMATGLFRVRSPLLTESRLMSFPPATEMFQFAGFASRPYGFGSRYPCGWVAPFGDPGITDRSHLPRASRLITASPSPAMPHHRRAQGQAPCRVPATAESGGLYEDTSFGQARRTLGWRRPGRRSFASPKGAKRGRHPTCPPRSHHNSLFTRQSTPRRGRPRRCRAIFSERRCGRTSGCHRPTLPGPGFAGGGGERIRTDDLLLAKQALSQLSYTPAPGIRRQDRVSDLLIPDPVSDA
jgi:hypothetical protein